MRSLRRCSAASRGFGLGRAAGAVLATPTPWAAGRAVRPGRWRPARDATVAAITASSPRRSGACCRWRRCSPRGREPPWRPGRSRSAVGVVVCNGGAGDRLARGAGRRGRCRRRGDCLVRRHGVHGAVNPYAGLARLATPRGRSLAGGTRTRRCRVEPQRLRRRVGRAHRRTSLGGHRPGGFSIVSSTSRPPALGVVLPPDNAQNWWRHQWAELGPVGALAGLACSLLAVLAGAGACDSGRDNGWALPILGLGRDVAGQLAGAASVHSGIWSACCSAAASSPARRDQPARAAARRRRAGARRFWIVAAVCVDAGRRRLADAPPGLPRACATSSPFNYGFGEATPPPPVTRRWAATPGSRRVRSRRPQRSRLRVTVPHRRPGARPVRGHDCRTGTGRLRRQVLGAGAGSNAASPCRRASGPSSQLDVGRPWTVTARRTAGGLRDRRASNRGSALRLRGPRRRQRR